jgi:hypothetical protein
MPSPSSATWGCILPWWQGSHVKKCERSAVKQNTVYLMILVSTGFFV